MDFDDFFLLLLTWRVLKHTFLENEFSSVLGLEEVTDDDLKEMGIKALGKRRHFMAAVKDITRKKMKVGQPEDEMCTPSKQSTSKIQSSTKYGKQSGIQNWLQSPFDEEKVPKSKKISLHTDSEIKKVYGLRRKKIEFKNSKLQELIKDPEGANFQEKQTKTIRKVTERVNRAKSDIKSVLRRIKDIKEDSEIDEKEKSRKIAKEEDELTIMHHELQKGTDSLRKACCIKIEQLKKLLQTIDIPENSDNGNESDVSASSIVEDILDQGLGENGKDGENKIVDHNGDEEVDEDEELEKL
ncbi:Hypothetical predicted protein [Mytilus galloprovincialis]|uniref:SAM domain-containing protein n=1 Tax=Mytilus galloprovincialis TaxID=29158 RepID=A0A8B6BFL9_MYTGA|nr:Hypothetical predicted protein [Mytilus galloprovincialis]